MKDYTNRDQRNYGDMDVAATAYPKFLEKLDVCRDLMYGFDYRDNIFAEAAASWPTPSPRAPTGCSPPSAARAGRTSSSSASL